MDFVQGTRLYQSVAVLSSWTVPNPLPHDHLDDLESFLYILVQIMFTYDSEGVAYSGPDMLSRWDKHSHDLRMASILKEVYLGSEFLPKEVEQHWPSPCVDLILAFTAFIHPLMLQKLELDQLTPTARKGKEKVFAADAMQHYTHILQLFDKAIEELDRPDTWRVSSAFSDGDSSDDSSCSDGFESALKILRARYFPPKRVSDDHPDDQPSAKRCKPPSK